MGKALREQIIAIALRKDNDIGADAMISEVEFGYWVAGSVWVQKSSLRQD